MDLQMTRHDKSLSVRLAGQFTFSDNAQFRDIIKELDAPSLASVQLDFSGVEFIDSAGLGMLLLLRDECQSRNIKLSLVAAHGQVERIFLISKFDQLFTLVS